MEQLPGSPPPVPPPVPAPMAAPVQPPTRPMPPQVKKGVSPILLAILGVVMVGGIAFAGLTFWQKGLLGSVPFLSKPTPTPTLAPEPTPTPEEPTPTPKPSPSTSLTPTVSQGTPVKIKSISLLSPTKGPLVIKGAVDSGWMFEGVMPVKLLDAGRQEIASGSAKETAPGSWQSGKAVDFSVSLTFTTESASGFLVFQNDNPSGLPANQKSFELPVRFRQ